MKSKQWLLAVGGGLLAVILVVASWLIYCMKPRPTAALVPGASADASSPVDPGSDLQGKSAPNFTLIDQFGKTISLSQFKGKTVILAFVDSECTNICPLTTVAMEEAVRMLGPDAASHVQMLGINANPTKVSVADVKDYSSLHGMMNSWHFLTASPNELKTVWKNYGIYSDIVNGQIDHTPALYIINAQGKEQTVFITPPQYSAVTAQASAIEAQLVKALPSGVHATAKAVNYIAPTVSPMKASELPALTPSGVKGTVTVAPGKTKLIAFFASWAPGTKQALTYLNEWSKQTGHPDVLAVDVAPTEPSATAAQQFLGSLPALNYAVAVDNTGQFSDAYGAQDVMWFALVDKNGNIVWTQDAWSTKAAFTESIQKALAKLSGN